MPQMNLFLDEKENKIIKNLVEEWKMNKHDVVKKIIRENKKVLDTIKYEIEENKSDIEKVELLKHLGTLLGFNLDELGFRRK